MTTKKSRGSALEPHAVFLRGVNVGGKNKLPMKELVQRLSDNGIEDVRSYIQSGNLVVSVEPKRAQSLPALIERLILDHFDLRVPVVARTRQSLDAIVRTNPFLEARRAPETLHVAFLAHTPSAVQIAALDPGRSAPDEFRVVGSEIFLYCPNGVGKSKLTNAYFDAKLSTMSTGRNWRTVQTLLEMLSPTQAV